MVVRLYAIFDRVAKEYMQPGEAANDGVALRMMRSWLKDNPYPDDFQVRFVGTFDKTNGVLSPIAAPVELEGQLDLELPADDAEARR